MVNVSTLISVSYSGPQEERATKVPRIPVSPMISIFFFILLDALQVFYSWIELVSQFGIYLPVEVGRLQTVFVMEAELLIISGASVGRPDDIQ